MNTLEKYRPSDFVLHIITSILLCLTIPCIILNDATDYLFIVHPELEFRFMFVIAISCLLCTILLVVKHKPFIFYLLFWATQIKLIHYGIQAFLIHFGTNA